MDLEPYLEDVPALAVAEGTSASINGVAAAGTRAYRTNDPVTLDDKWHLGSITKSMTALLLARLLPDDGFDQPITAHAQDAHPDWEQVTLRDVMAHRGGTPANFPRRHLVSPPTSPTTRKDLLAPILANPPGGREYLYSNVGYTLLGHVAERVTGSPWETAIRSHVFEPLDIRSAGFGPPPPPNPQGHRRWLGVRTSAIAPDTAGSDNPEFMSPAGRVHMSIKDFAVYAGHLLALLRGTDGIVSAAKYIDLTRPLGDYGGGLLVHKEAGKSEPVRLHDGSNTLWYALMALDPAGDRFAAIATNIATLRAQKLVNDLARKILT